MPDLIRSLGLLLAALEVAEASYTDPLPGPRDALRQKRLALAVARYREIRDA
jgi:hypothetical protein